MTVRYQKRVNLGNGSGINLSKSGASYSRRTKWGSFGSRGFSIRTGIPGLSYRHTFGKGKKSDSGALIVVWIIVMAIIASAVILYNLVLFLIWLIAKISFQISAYREKKRQERQLIS